MPFKGSIPRRKIVWIWSLWRQTFKLTCMDVTNTDGHVLFLPSIWPWLKVAGGKYTHPHSLDLQAHRHSQIPLKTSHKKFYTVPSPPWVCFQVNLAFPLLISSKFVLNVLTAALGDASQGHQLVTWEVPTWRLSLLSTDRCSLHVCAFNFPIFCLCLLYWTAVHQISIFTNQIALYSTSPCTQMPTEL